MHKRPWFESAQRVCAWLAALLLTGCAVTAYRPYTKALYQEEQSCSAPLGADPDRHTPERSRDNTYTLHFVEFDDQGWAFPDEHGNDNPPGTASRQIDCAIKDIAHSLRNDKNEQLLTFVYVHGWNHSAAPDDEDLSKFRELLADQAKRTTRRVVGIYVGWQGNTWDVPGLRQLTFWGRKNAAHHVAEGRVRELFSRLRGLRAHYNDPEALAKEEAKEERRRGRRKKAGLESKEEPWSGGQQQKATLPAVNTCGTLTGGDNCRLRVVMMGHSFGGLILFNSAAPYLLEMLSLRRDLEKEVPLTDTDSDAEAQAEAAVEAARARARGIADLIVLLNPAFEASRYEPVFEASRHYRARVNEPPILVSVTSTADWATRVAFPIARWFNSIFQYPASSNAQSSAMRRTHGHIDRYLTHQLCVADADTWCRPIVTDEPSGVPAQHISRRFCGGLVLQAYKQALSAPRSIVWNVRTDGRIMANHSDITRPELMRFVSQVYGEVTGIDSGACEPDFEQRRAAAVAEPTAVP